MEIIDYTSIKDHPGWDKTQHYINNERRSRRSILIISESITELLSTGSCLIIEHQGSPQTLKYHENFTSCWFYQGMQGLFYNISIKELKILFPIRLIMDDDNYCLELYIVAKEQGSFQYNTGYEPYLLKANISTLEKDLQWWKDKHQGCVNIIERLRSSVWEYIKFRLKI